MFNAFYIVYYNAFFCFPVEKYISKRKSNYNIGGVEK